MRANVYVFLVFFLPTFTIWADLQTAKMRGIEARCEVITPKSALSSVPNCNLHPFQSCETKGFIRLQ